MILHHIAIISGTEESIEFYKRLLLACFIECKEFNT